MDRVARNPRHRRRHSWPPVRLGTKKRPARKNIDEDPFAFFISPPDEPQPSYLFDNVDAGIETSPPLRTRTSRVQCRKPVRRWRQRAQAQKAVTKLKHWMKRMERFYRSVPLEAIVEVVPPPISLIDHLGLPDALRNPFVPNEREVFMPNEMEVEPEPVPVRRLRAHSARPRSWLEPPADIWTVMEDNEEDDSATLGRSVPTLPRSRLHS